MYDTDFLPKELLTKSLSRKEIVLIYEDALNAINYLVSSSAAVAGWEGWLRYDDGKHGHSQTYQGTTSICRLDNELWGDYVLRSADICRETIELAQKSWNREPEIQNGQLYFCLTVLISN